MEGLLAFGQTQDDIYDETIRYYLENRRLILNTIIDDDILEDVTLHILKWNKEDKNLPAESREPIWLYIQSPGGDVINGNSLIDAIEASQTPVYTVCFSQCNSMGFHIFIAGHKRYCFKNSILLIHDGQINISNSSSKAKDTMKFIDVLDQRVKSHVLKHTKITSEFYDSIYDTEYYVYGNTEGKELGIVDFVIGEDVSLEDIL